MTPLPTCPVCSSTAVPGAEDFSSVYAAGRYSLAHCRSCRHYATWPTPAADELARIYQDLYRYDVHQLIAGEKRMRARWLARRIAELAPASRVLEVGCMHGDLLAALKSHGVEAEGLELDPGAVAECARRGLRAACGRFEDYQRPPAPPDVVVMAHVLEHFEDLRAALHKAHSLLAPGGWLVLATPNHECFSRRIFGKHWGWWQVPVHLNHFSGQSLGRAVEAAGFQPVQVRFRGADSLFWLSSLANLAGLRSRSNMRIGARAAAAIRSFSLLARGWYFFGREEAVVFARRPAT